MQTPSTEKFLIREKWFHGRLPNGFQDAEQLLANSLNKNGTFLVHENATFAKDFSISFVYVQHLCINIPHVPLLCVGTYIHAVVMARLYIGISIPKLTMMVVHTSTTSLKENSCLSLSVILSDTIRSIILFLYPDLNF